MQNKEVFRFRNIFALFHSPVQVVESYYFINSPEQNTINPTLENYTEVFFL